MALNTGIYKIENKLNSKCYIGSAVNIKARLAVHRSDLNLNRHCNSYLQRAWNKYGENSFNFEPLLYCDKKNLIFYEQKTVDKIHTVNGVYNLRLCVENTGGWKHSDISKQKISNCHKGRKLSEEHKKKIAASVKTSFTEEHKQKLLSINRGNKYCLGKITSEEIKQKIAKANKGQIPWNLGKTVIYSDSVKKRKSEALKGNKHRLGKPHSKETKFKMSLAHIGRVVSEETRQKLSELGRGRIPWNKGMINVYSEQAKRKMKESSKKRKRSKYGQFCSAQS